MLRRAFRLAAGVGAGVAGLAGTQMAYAYAKFELLPDAQGPHAGVAGAALAGQPRKAPSTDRRVQHRNIVFLGDSLVAGVGCSSEPPDGPIMPRTAAEVLASRLGVDVRWLALGETGADVRTLREMLPTLADEAARCGQRGERIDAVVVFCGFNDIKSCLLFLQPWLGPSTFSQDLAQLTTQIRQAAGEQCSVLLPGVPLERAPRFADIWPLSLFVTATIALWEAQKRGVADAGATGVRYVHSPIGIRKEVRSRAEIVRRSCGDRTSACIIRRLISNIEVLLGSTLLRSARACRRPPAAADARDARHVAGALLRRRHAPE